MQASLDIRLAPRIDSGVPADDGRLLVRFQNGAAKSYDCRALLQRPEFFLLKTKAFFNAVRVDPGGHGISWSDALDLSGAELWENGVAETNAPEPRSATPAPRG